MIVTDLGGYGRDDDEVESMSHSDGCTFFRPEFFRDVARRGTEPRRSESRNDAYDAIVPNLEVLGEACKGVPGDVRARDEEIAWRRIAGLRDVLAHAYFGVDEDIVWNVVSAEVPALLPRLIALRAARWTMC